MNKLFVSYSRKDAEFSRKLVERLEAENMEVWVDWEDIPPSVDWMKQIQKGIEEANIFLFIVSPDSLASKVCAEELNHGAANGKRILPVIARDVEASAVPPSLSHLNWIFFSRPQDHFDEAFQKVIAAIRTDFEWAQVHSRLQVKALEWERGQREDSLLLRGKDLQDAEAQLSVNQEKDPKPTPLQTEYAAASRRAEENRLAAERAKEFQILMEQKIANRLRRLTYAILSIFTIAFVALFIWLNNVTTDLAVESIKNQMLAVVETSVCFIDGGEYADFLAYYPEESDAVYEDDYYARLEYFMLDVIDTNENIQAETVLYTVAASENPNEFFIVNSTDAEHPVAYKTSIPTNTDNQFNIDGMQGTSANTDIYTDEYGTWISACSPIQTSEGENVGGALCADFNAQLLEDTRAKVTFTLGGIFIAIYPAMVILVIFATHSMSQNKTDGKKVDSPF
ncbi:MAG: hypothetical protein Fur002_00130 [Anaerolineales bacterium]